MTTAAPEKLCLRYVDETVARLGRTPDACIPILQALQAHYHYLPEPALRRVTELTAITPAQIAGVASFYSQFRHTPAGEHIVRICHGTACHVKGSELIEDALRRTLHIPADQDTDAAGEFTIERVGCIGCCTLAPVAQVHATTYGNLTPQSAPAILTIAPAAHAAPAILDSLPDGTDGEIRIGTGSCCIAGGSMDVKNALERSVRATAGNARVKSVGCVGMCHQTPLVEITLAGKPAILYTRVRSEDAAAIVRRHFAPRSIARRLRASINTFLDNLLTPAPTPPPIAKATRDGEICEFLGPQKRIATEYCGHLDPLDIDEYQRHHGFAGLTHALSLSPEALIQHVADSGLRGRGGAGFPTARKWAATRNAPGATKYLVCNGDEGDPGAFMDRMILESYPYRVIEGMRIAAHATGATHGIFYIRAEYPLAVERIRKAIAICEQRGLLHNFPITVYEGAGAFVCGEETALIRSVEGFRGMPVLRPPYPAERGLHDCPTNINNVETLALVPWILRSGPAAFNTIGTTHSKGTKVFALTGKVRRGGLIEVPMGTTIRQIVEDIGGGVPDGTFKAVQIGGPSGGCLPAHLADTPVDYESLAHVGAIMGSGGLVVMDDHDCMVDIARYFLHFTQTESCGKCTLCRIGTKRMLEILTRICEGKGRKSDLAQLEELASSVKAGSLCGLGQTAPNPVLTTLRYFKHELEEHLNGICRAGKCKALIRYAVTDTCNGCTRCAQACPTNAIPWTPYQPHTIDPNACTRCDICRPLCPTNAIQILPNTKEHPSPSPLHPHPPKPEPRPSGSDQSPQEEEAPHPAKTA